LIATADRVITLEGSTLFLEKPVKTGPALPVVSLAAPPNVETSTKAIPRRRYHGEDTADV
jgi:hypothetical protein